MTASALALRLAPAVVVFFCSVGFLVWAYSYEGRGEMMPALTGWLLVTLSFLDIVAATPTRIGHGVAEFFAGKVIGEAKSESHGGVMRSLVAMAWPGAFVAGVILFGFFLTIPVYVFLFMLLFGKKTLKESVLGAAATTAFTLVVFEWLLQYEVFRGILFG
ncbi:MAG TPA: tripartite tricarboxylate transporter TctB family protein, partial [Hyphomicrobiales bacterium]|nr:tripartite tricarboxylate transporter TctB family protein [Hyphomicrobiales bacterium]